MKRRQSGNAAIIVLVVVTALLIIGVGIFVWQRQNNQPVEVETSDETSNSAEIEEAKKTVEKTEPEPEVITEVSLTLQHVGDELKLPDVTPESFVEYMKIRLNDFVCDFVEFPNGGFNVTKISNRFVAGGIGCEGGAATIWYLTGIGWDELGYQSEVPCSSLVERAIPSDFLAQCYDDANPEAIIDNPNGPLNPTN